MHKVVAQSYGLWAEFRANYNGLWLALAFSLFGLSAVFWIIGIKKTALAKAFSIVSLNYILIFSYSFFHLQESLSWYKLASCLFIICGVIILAQNENIKLLYVK